MLEHLVALGYELGSVGWEAMHGKACCRGLHAHARALLPIPSHATARARACACTCSMQHARTHADAHASRERAAARQVRRFPSRATTEVARSRHIDALRFAYLRDFVKSTNIVARWRTDGRGRRRARPEPPAGWPTLQCNLRADGVARGERPHAMLKYPPARGGRTQPEFYCPGPLISVCDVRESTLVES